MRLRDMPREVVTDLRFVIPAVFNSGMAGHQVSFV